MFLHQTFPGMEYDTILKMLKRKHRCVDVDKPFRSKMFKTHTKSAYFSVKCFNLLLSKSYLKKIRKGIDKEAVVKELDQLLVKHAIKEMECDEDDADDCIMTRTVEVDEPAKAVVEDVGPPMVKICEVTIPYQVCSIYVGFPIPGSESRGHLSMPIPESRGINVIFNPHPGIVKPNCKIK